MIFNTDGYAEALGLNYLKSKEIIVDALMQYELGGLAAVVVDAPADTAIARSIEIEGDEDRSLFYELERLAFLPKIADAVRWSRLFGGAALVLITDDGILNQPLDLANKNQRNTHLWLRPNLADIIALFRPQKT